MPSHELELLAREPALELLASFTTWSLQKNAARVQHENFGRRSISLRENGKEITMLKKKSSKWYFDRQNDCLIVLVGRLN